MAEESERPLELNDLLGHLRKEGQVVSSGAFTIDLIHAREKLKEFQLVEPTHYVLKLVQAAVAAGASAIHLDSSKPKVVLRMAGVTFSAFEIESLFGYLFEERRDYEKRHFRALAVAVNSALGIGAREISLESSDGTRGVRHQWTAKGPSQRETNGKGGRFTEFVLHRSLTDVRKNLWSTLNNDLLDLLFHRREAMDSEQAIVYDRCSFSHVPIFINGVRLKHIGFGRPRYPGCPAKPQRADVLPGWRAVFSSGDYRFGIHRGHHLVERFYPAHEDGPEPSLFQPPESSATLSLDYQARERCYMAIGIPAGLPLSLRIFVVEDGVMLQKEVVPTQSLGGNVIVCGSRFVKDLTEFGINKDSLTAVEHLMITRLTELRRELAQVASRIPIHLMDLVQASADPLGLERP